MNKHFANQLPVMIYTNPVYSVAYTYTIRHARLCQMVCAVNDGVITAFHLYSEVGICEFPGGKLQLERPLKSEASHNPDFEIRASTVVESCSNTVNPLIMAGAFIY